MDLKLLLALALGIWLCLPPLTHAEMVTVSRRLVRFDGKPAAGAKVRVLGDYGCFDKNTDFEATSDADGILSVDVPQTNEMWVGHLLIQADGCAPLCEVGVTGRRRSEPLTPVLRLGAAYYIEGKTTDAKGRPVAGAKITLVSARFAQWNETQFNSTMTQLTTTPEFVASSDANGEWSMPGIDFVDRDRLVPVTVIFETVAANPLLEAKIDLKLAPDPGTGTRTNVSLDFKLAPPIRVTGRVVNSTDGQPVAGALCSRGEVFTTLAGSAATTDKAGRFELNIPGPLTGLWFWVYRDGFAETTAATAIRVQATSEWEHCKNLSIALHPLMSVLGTVLDENGKPPGQALEITARYEGTINAIWGQQGVGGGRDSMVGADGTFHARLPAGHVTLNLGPVITATYSLVSPVRMNYQLSQPVDIPASGMTGLHLVASEINNPKQP